MQTNAQLIDQAMGRLGQRSSTRIRGDVVTEINTAIDNLEIGDFQPWFLESTAVLNVTAGDTFVDLPSDFAIEAEYSRPYYVEEGKVYYLTKRFVGALQGEDPPELRYYAISGEEFHFRMPADKSYTVMVPYIAKQSGDLVDNADPVSNVWLLNAKEWVVGEALTTVAATNLVSNELAQVHATFAAKGKRQVFVHHEARVNRNQDFEVGGASDGS